MGLGAFLGMTDGGGVSLQPMPSTLCLTSPQRQPPPPVPTSVLNEEKTSGGSPRKGDLQFRDSFSKPPPRPAGSLPWCVCVGGAFGLEGGIPGKKVPERVLCGRGWENLRKREGSPKGGS